MSKELALFCILHPATVEKKQRILSLLSTARSYYTSAPSKCTTWTYFTPIHDPAVTPSLISEAETRTAVATMELYTDKSALPFQLQSPEYQAFHAAVRDEQLYVKDEELVAWYPAAGFVARGEGARLFGRGVMVMTPAIVCKPGKRDELVRVLSDYADWVRNNEPGFLTYSIMTRPKAPDEVLIWERCAGVEALNAHVSTSELAQAMKLARRCMKSVKGQKWLENDDSFVGSVPGEFVTDKSSKL